MENRHDKLSIELMLQFKGTVISIRIIAMVNRGMRNSIVIIVKESEMIWHVVTL